MNTNRVAANFLRAVGCLLVILGLVHLAATPHIAGLLRGSPRAVYEHAVGPTLLNHVLVGILLLPLGYTTWLAAASGQRGESWALRVLLVNAATVLTLPISVLVFMRRPEYYKAPMFLAGVALVAAISLLSIVAICLLLRKQVPPR